MGGLALLLGLLHERRSIWTYSLTSLVLAGAAIYPASITGDKAEDSVKHAWYIVQGSIDKHSAAADVTVWIVLITGLLALIALITMVREPAAQAPGKAFRVLVGLGALASFAAISYTGFLGGKVVIESPVLESPTPPLIMPPGTPVPTGPAAGQLPAPAGSAAPVSPAQPGSPAPQAPIPQTSIPQTQTQVPAPAKP